MKPYIATMSNGFDFEWHLNIEPFFWFSNGKNKTADFSRSMSGSFFE
jgi:hypothetical protein